MSECFYFEYEEEKESEIERWKNGLEAWKELPIRNLETEYEGDEIANVKFEMYADDVWYVTMCANVKKINDKWYIYHLWGNI